MPLSLSVCSQVFLGNPASCCRILVMRHRPLCMCVFGFVCTRFPLHVRFWIFSWNPSSTGTPSFGSWYKASLSEISIRLHLHTHKHTHTQSLPRPSLRLSPAGSSLPAYVNEGWLSNNFFKRYSKSFYDELRWNYCRALSTNQNLTLTEASSASHPHAHLLMYDYNFKKFFFFTWVLHSWSNKVKTSLEKKAECLSVLHQTPWTF